MFAKEEDVYTMIMAIINKKKGIFCPLQFHKTIPVQEKE